LPCQTIPETLRDRFSGVSTRIPLLHGEDAIYINFDNAASTPPLHAVQSGVDRFVEYYASVHRGTGFKSQLSTWAYETARAATLRFVDADPAERTCIFVKNSTEAINKLAHRLNLEPDDVILTTVMEHHSNDLPFRAVAETVHIDVCPDGSLDEDDFDRKLTQYSDRVRLVSISGASNVTGFLNPVRRLAAKSHAAGAYFMVDSAQLAPHRTIHIGALDEPDHFDFIALSAHKMYAPYGTGALIGRTDVFSHGDPDLRGGGTVDIVTLDDVVWADTPERDEAGSPNVVGAVALALAIRELTEIGMDVVAQHETELTAYALETLSQVPDVHIFGDTNPTRAHERLGVIPFLLEGKSHFLVSAILGYEFGIGVRAGCFCAHPYLLRLLDVDTEAARRVREKMVAGDRRDIPGLIRISFGLYNTTEEIDRLAQALEAIQRGDYQGRYTQDASSGEYRPEGWAPDFNSYFPLA